VRKIPSEGEVVQVRGGYWAVSDVKTQGLPRSSADESSGLQHLVSLSSVAGDRLGEEIRVIWELEVGATVLPDVGLPEVDAERFDSPELFAAFLDALRWGAITSADSRTLQAPFRSGAAVEAYQLEPVSRALKSSRANMLLADDVGLGKTIEAGLVIQELLLRHRARTVCVVCPAGLAVKWQLEMRDKFGLDFKIINSETMKDVRRTHGVHVNPFSLFPRIIVSMQWLPGDRASRLLNEIYETVDQDLSGRAKAFDILVVDEAHHVAPSSPTNTGNGRKGYAVDSLRTRAVRKLAERCEHRLFLTATPHNGYTESFTALLEMIDNRRFVRGATVNPKNLTEVVVRRLKKTLTELGVKSFPPRHVEPMLFEPTDGEIAAYARLEAFLDRRKKASKSKQGGDMASLLLKKRFLSSPLSFAHTVDTYMSTRGGFVEMNSDYDDVLGTDADELEEGRVDQAEFLVLQDTKSGAPALTAEDKEDLRWLANWGHEFTASPDSRLTALLDYLEATVRSNGEFNNERVVIFTEYVDTLNWIQANLASRGYDSARVEVIVGDTPSEERELIKARFQEHPANDLVRILLATDAAGEGIDLQNYCHRLVNYDVPFNPNRLEQRAGRIDRYGQKNDPIVYHFVPSSKAKSSGYVGDFEMLDRIAQKVVRQESDLGPGNQLIRLEIEQRLLEGKSVTQTKKSKTDFLVNEVLAGERDVRRELTEQEEALSANRNRLHAHPANVYRVVNEALKLDHQPVLDSYLEPGTELQLCRVPNLSLPWVPALRNLYGVTHPDVRRPISFDGEAVGDRTDVVFAHLGHQLVQRSSQLLRSALWKGQSGINRVTAVTIPDLDESIVAAVCRMVLVGRGGLRLHEEVFLAGARLTTGRALGEAASEEVLERALDGSNFKIMDASAIASVVSTWHGDQSEKGLQHRVQSAITKRQAKRQSEVQDLLAKRKADDLARVQEIFDRFETILRDSLKSAQEEEQHALGLLFDDEKEQRIHDIKQWTDRLVTVSDERKREVASVERRYEDVKPFVMPAALIFAISPKDSAK